MAENVPLAKEHRQGQKFKVEDESPTEYARSSRRCFGLVQLYRTLPSAIFEFVFVFWWFTKARVSDLSSCVPCQRGYKCFLKIQQKEEIPNFRNEEAETVLLLQSWVQSVPTSRHDVLVAGGAAHLSSINFEGASFKHSCQNGFKRKLILSGVVRIPRGSVSWQASFAFRFVLCFFNVRVLSSTWPAPP